MGGARLAVLVVDDDPSTRRVMEHAVDSAFGGRAVVDAVSSGEEALALMGRHAYSLVLSDYQLGLVNGIDLLEHARREHPEGVRVLVTGHAALPLAQEAIARAKVHAFFTKPFTVDELRGRLRDALRAQS